ncbi:MAG: MFS transporter [Pseudomonadales bacterium]
MPASVRAWGTLGVLMAAYTISFIDRTILSLLIPPIQQDLGISDTQISLLVGMAFAVFYTFMGIPLGRIADRHNRRNLIAVGIAVWCLMTAACGLARNYWQLFVARIGVGVGEAALSPAAYSLISDLFPREQLGRAIALYSVGLPIGSGLALLIGGFVIETLAGLPPVDVPFIGILRPWQLTFLVVGLPGIFVALLVMTLHEPARRGRAGEAGSPALPQAQAVSGVGLIQFLRLRRRVLAHQFGGLALLVIIVYGCTAWIPTFFIRVHGWTAAEIGTAYGVIFMICGSGGLLAGGQLADRWWRAGRKDAHLRVVLLSVVTMTPCFALMPWVSSADIAIVLLAAATFTSSLHGGVAGAALQLITPNELRGQMTAVYFFIANLVGLGLGPTVVALITDYGFRDAQSVGMSLTLLSAFAGIGSILALSSGLMHYRRCIE